MSLLHTVIPTCPWLPERVASLGRLLEALAHPRIVVTVREESLELERRLGERNVWLGWQEPWPEGATHRLVIDDDMVPAKDFAPALLQILDRFPDEPVALFCVSPIALAAAERRCHLVRWKWFGGGGAMLLPRRTAEEFARNPPDGAGVKTTDRLLNEFIERRGIEVLHPVPCLVDHDAFLDSALGHRGSPPVASIAFGPLGSALAVDWTRAHVERPLPGDMSRPVTRRYNWTG